MIFGSEAVKGNALLQSPASVFFHSGPRMKTKSRRRLLQKRMTTVLWYLAQNGIPMPAFFIQDGPE